MKYKTSITFVTNEDIELEKLLFITFKEYINAKKEAKKVMDLNTDIDTEKVKNFKELRILLTQMGWIIVITFFMSLVALMLATLAYIGG